MVIIVSRGGWVECKLLQLQNPLDSIHKAAQYTSSATLDKLSPECPPNVLCQSITCTGAPGVVYHSSRWAGQVRPVVPGEGVGHRCGYRGLVYSGSSSGD